MDRTIRSEVRDAMTRALAAGGFASMEEAAWEVSLTVALSKVSGYERECEGYRRKYEGTFESIKARIEAQVGHEDFAVEDDLADWEFAEAALREWKARAQVLRDAAP